MNWFAFLELGCLIAVCEMIYLPLTYWAWTYRESEPCVMFRLTDAAEFKVHAAETQALPPPPSNGLGTRFWCAMTPTMLTKLAGYWLGLSWRQAWAGMKWKF